MSGYAVRLRRSRKTWREAVEVKVSVEVSGIPDDHHEFLQHVADKAAGALMRELERIAGGPVDG